MIVIKKLPIRQFDDPAAGEGVSERDCERFVRYLIMTRTSDCDK